jgi:hypothetical protein
VRGSPAASRERCSERLSNSRARRNPCVSNSRSPSPETAPRRCNSGQNAEKGGGGYRDVSVIDRGLWMTGYGLSCLGNGAPPEGTS